MSNNADITLLAMRVARDYEHAQMGWFSPEYTEAAIASDFDADTAKAVFRMFRAKQREWEEMAEVLGVSIAELAA